MVDQTELCEFIKIQIRNQGLTVERFAQEMSVPLPTLKRWLRGEGVSLASWVRMLDSLGLTLSDVASTVSEPTFKQFEYTVSQEKELAKVPGLIAFFQELLTGKDADLIAQKHKLSSRSVAFYLRRLAAIDLIIWGEDRNIKIKTRGEPQWRKNGELAKAFRNKVFSELIAAKPENLKIGLYDLAEKDELKLREMFTEIFLFAQQAEKRARIANTPIKSIGISWIMERYSAEFLNSIPNRS